MALYCRVCRARIVLWLQSSLQEFHSCASSSRIHNRSSTQGQRNHSRSAGQRLGDGHGNDRSLFIHGVCIPSSLWVACGYEIWSLQDDMLGCRTMWYRPCCDDHFIRSIGPHQWPCHRAFCTLIVYACCWSSNVSSYLGIISRSTNISRFKPCITPTIMDQSPHKVQHVVTDEDGELVLIDPEASLNSVMLYF